MTEIINNPDINTLLFKSNRENFGELPETAEAVELNDSNGNRIKAQFYLHDTKSANIIFYPSADTSLASYEEMANSYVAHGLNVLLLSYRADNNSEIECTLADFYDDGRTLFTQAIKWFDDKGLTGAKLVMGQSLGSILAIDVVSHDPDPVKGILLESAMCQTVDYLANRGLDTRSIDGLEEKGFGNLEKIEKIKLATLIFHGAKDSLIPIADAEKLQASSGARTKQFFIIPGAEHDSLYQSGGKLYFETIKTFIDTLCGVNTWRQKRRKYQDSQEK